MHVDPRECRQGDEAGQDEEKPRQRPCEVSTLLVADVDRELQRLGSGEDVAEVQGANELLLADPFLPLDYLEVHQADLADRTAEG